MTGLSRCGRVYKSLDEAYKAAEQRTYKTGRKHVVRGCAICADWHVIEERQVIVSRSKPYRPGPFPPLVAKLIDKRDEGLCQRCGRETRLERHHRRAKSMGGSRARSHSQCPCNALSLCRTCHAWVHANPARAREHGWIVSQSIALPVSIMVCVGLGLGSFGEVIHDPRWATCDGRWVHSPGEAED